MLATSYRAELFAQALGDGSRRGVRIADAVEDEPLGTGGAIRNAADQLAAAPDEPVVVFNGDVVDSHDIAGVTGTSRSMKRLITGAACSGTTFVIFCPVVP